MTRRRWVQRKQEDGSYKLEEVDLDFRGQRRNLGDMDALISERHYEGMRATDGTDISSRAKHKEYMKRNNLTTMDDFTETWAKEPRRRELERQKDTKEAVERAIHHLEGPT